MLSSHTASRLVAVAFLHGVSRACGVVVSHPLSMRGALNSNLSMSIFALMRASRAARQEMCLGLAPGPGFRPPSRLLRQDVSIGVSIVRLDRPAGQYIHPGRIELPTFSVLG